MDSKNTYKEHVVDLKARCYQAMNIMKCLSHVKWGADRAILLRLFQSLIQSRLDYGCQAYGTGHHKVVSLLDPVLNTGMRLSLGAFKSSRTTSLLVEAGVLSLEERRWFLITKQYLKYLQNEEHNKMAKEIIGPRFRSCEPWTNTTFVEGARILMEMCPVTPKVMPMGRPPCPWEDVVPVWCQELALHTKDATPARALRSLFLEHANSTHGGSELIFTDNSKSSSHAGFAVVASSQEFSSRIDSTSSIFTAELLAIQKSLDLVLESNTKSGVICSDSKSALEALCKAKPDNPIALSIRERLIFLRERGYHLSFCWSPAHVGIQGNERADELAKNALVRRCDNIGLPFGDYLSLIRRGIWTGRQLNWDRNVTDKLREVKLKVGPWESPGYPNRRVETAICRLRIGHTRLTHEHLMKKTDPRQCHRCRVVLSVKHILVECPNLNRARRRWFQDVEPPLTLHKLLAEGPNYNPRRVVQFMQSIGMLNRL